MDLFPGERVGSAWLVGDCVDDLGVGDPGFDPDRT